MVRRDISTMRKIVNNPVELAEFNKHFKSITLTSLPDFLECADSFGTLVERVRTFCFDRNLTPSDVLFLLCYTDGVLVVLSTESSWAINSDGERIKREQRSTLAHVQKLFFDAVGPGVSHAQKLSRMAGAPTTLASTLSRRHTHRVLSKRD